jgi:hypothetical protein
MKSHAVMQITLYAGLVSIYSACSNSEPPARRSAIVGMVENAGSGDLSSASSSQIEDWFRKHRDLAVQVDDTCKTPREKADAQWPATMEGRICTAARNASMFYRQYHNPSKPKGDVVGPG